MLVSIVISTWRRPALLKEILEALENQGVKKRFFEILVVDSNSGDETESVCSQAIKNGMINVRYLNIDRNTASAKRNFGLGVATGKIIVFLDDDCIPDENYIFTVINSVHKIRNSPIILCGGVYFDRELVKNSNYYRYRDSCHFSKFNKTDRDHIEFNEIVTMNMCAMRHLFVNNQMHFDESFVGYGCEDIFFGYCATLKGVTLVPFNGNILHSEPYGSLEGFCLKIYRSARDGANTLLNKNADIINLLKNSMLLENISRNDNLRIVLKKLLAHVVCNKASTALLCKFLVVTDRINFLYSKALFRLVLAGFARMGVVDRGSNPLTLEKANVSGWYD